MLAVTRRFFLGDGDDDGDGRRFAEAVGGGEGEFALREDVALAVADLRHWYRPNAFVSPSRAWAVVAVNSVAADFLEVSCLGKESGDGSSFGEEAADEAGDDDDDADEDEDDIDNGELGVARVVFEAESRCSTPFVIGFFDLIVFFSSSSSGILPRFWLPLALFRRICGSTRLRLPSGSLTITLSVTFLSLCDENCDRLVAEFVLAEGAEA